MPTYIRLTTVTEQGSPELGENPDRTERMRELAAETGGEIKDVYLTFGPYDFVTIAEFPDDEAYATFTLKFQREGGYDTQTLKAFEEDEYRGIFQALG